MDRRLSYYGGREKESPAPIGCLLRIDHPGIGPKRSFPPEFFTLAPQKADGFVSSFADDSTSGFNVSGSIQ
jgi:hypothetical protein